MIKICLVTANRAEYGILRDLIISIKKDKNIQLEVVVTGSHLDKKFGLTKNEILQDKIRIKKIINVYPKKDNSYEILNSISKSLLDISKFLRKNNYNFLIILGDRYEIISPGLSAFFNKIPIIHFNGGDITEGSLDNNIRDLITSISNLHLVSNKKSYDRVKKIIGSNKNIHNIGSLSANRILKQKMLNKKILEKILKINFNKYNYLITFHPITNKKNQTYKQFNSILESMEKQKECTIIFTYPNNDEDSEIIINLIKKFISKNKNSYLFKSLGFEKYISICKKMTCVIGNSSSFILEIPFLNIPSINVGNRQKGRIIPKTVISVDANQKEITKAIKIIKEKKIVNNKKTNIYLKSNNIKKIINIIKNYNINNG